MRKIKTTLAMILAGMLMLAMSSCSKVTATSCYQFIDCSGQELNKVCDQTEEQAAAYAAAHSSSTCQLRYVRQ